jgi:two-component system alkaline phosphatase synthesis response regulator PhoP
MKKQYRILAVDDDADILELLQYNLEMEGFIVKTVSDCKKALTEAIDFLPDLIILDIMMTPLSGIDICKQLRGLATFRYTYIFFLTARSEHYYQDAALDTGGDDFIEKIIGLRALTSKVATVLKGNYVIRKSQPSVIAGNLVIHRKASVAYLNGIPLKLSKIELDFLFFFAQNPKKAITEESLINNIWGSDTFSVASSIHFYLENLAKKLGPNWLVDIGKGRFKFIPH